jgi:hypothetical protein
MANRSLRRSSVCAAAIRAYLLLSAGLAFAAAETASMQSRLSWNGDPTAPDISGVWVRDAAANAVAAGASREGWHPWPAPLKAPFAAIWKQRVTEAAAGNRSDDPVQRCLPPGMPRYMSGTTGPLLIIQSKGRVTFYRDNAPVRRIWMDGRKIPAPDDLEEFSNGNAIGSYEGAELVIRSAGFKDYPIDGTGVPHSDQLTIVERIRRVNAQSLQVEITLTDPKAYQKPLLTTVYYRPHSDPLWEPSESVCVPKTNYHPELYVR